MKMISAWKKFMNKQTSDHETIGQNGSKPMPNGIQKLDKELQRKFAKGVNYNMKIVIKGDNRVGKTSLFLRLKGYGFEDKYNPTESLNVTSIDWNYKATDDIVKIDLWEAIDAASRKNMNFVDLKMENKDLGTTNQSVNQQSNGNHQSNSNMSNNNNNNNDPSHYEPVKSRMTIVNSNLSAINSQNSNCPIPESARQSLNELSENLDVYKGSHAVLLVMDMTKNWTFKYIQSELPKIPPNIPVLIVANHRDQGHHRTVTAEQVKAFIDCQIRNVGDGVIMYTEASMKNGFGMKFIERFFNIPFLKLQEASLLKQLELNRQEYLTTHEELNLMQDSTSKKYEQYLELETIRRRQQADALSPINNGLKQLDETTREQIRNATVSSDIIDKTANVTSIESKNDKQLNAPVLASQSFVNDRLPSIVIGAKCPLPETKSIQITTSSDTKSVVVNQSKSEIKSTDDCGGDKNNGDDDDKSEDSEDDEEVPRANPLVADYQSDLDSDDQIASAR